MITRPAILLSFVLIGTAISAQWTPRPSGTTHFLRDIFFPTPQTGFAVGDSGIIVRSQDAGENWSVVLQMDSVDLVSVHFPTLANGFAAGGNWAMGLVLRTTDGGDTWAPCATAAQQFGSVRFLDEQTGYAGGAGYVLHTADGGDTWDTIPGMATGAMFNSISIPSPQTGYFIGGTSAGDQLYKTTDGGLSSEFITNGFQVIKETSQFLNEGTGFMGGWYAPMLEKTIDGGANWNSILDVFSGGVWDLQFLDEQHGYYVGWGGAYGYVKYTEDGGASWTEQYAGPSSIWLEGLCMVDAMTGFACGSNGAILKTTNGGMAISELGFGTNGPMIWPDPAGDMITMEIGALRSGIPVTLEWSDLRGRSLCIRGERSDGSTVRSAVPAELADGCYLLTVRARQEILGQARIIVRR